MHPLVQRECGTAELVRRVRMGLGAEIALEARHAFESFVRAQIVKPNASAASLRNEREVERVARPVRAVIAIHRRRPKEQFFGSEEHDTAGYCAAVEAREPQLRVVAAVFENGREKAAR